MATTLDALLISSILPSQLPHMDRCYQNALAKLPGITADEDFHGKRVYNAFRIGCKETGFKPYWWPKELYTYRCFVVAYFQGKFIQEQVRLGFLATRLPNI